MGMTQVARSWFTGEYIRSTEKLLEDVKLRITYPLVELSFLEAQEATDGWIICTVPL